MYKSIIKPLLFLFPPERAHKITFRLLTIAFAIPGIRLLTRKIHTITSEKLQKTIWGIPFPNPVGLAAGFDKDAKHIDDLAAFGFGFIEIGTVTPQSQPGNPQPRLFRLPKDGALINRMGFNNEGLDAAVRRLKNRKSPILIGGNIGKNKVTPNEEALNDYEKGLLALYDQVDYFVVNLSSPNTPGLRELQDKEPLRKLLMHLQQKMEEKTNKKPLLLKIAPDLTAEQLDDIVEISKELSLDGLVATNTTIDRSNLSTSENYVQSIGAGGLSGGPLEARSNEVIRYCREKLGPDFVIIGVGGIMTHEAAVEKLKAGADLIQIYTGFIYQGPSFIKNINKAILQDLA